MARSPSLNKAERASLGKSQEGKLQRAVENLEASQRDLAEKRDRFDAKREDLTTKRTHLKKLTGQLHEHPLAKRRDAKKDEVSAAKEELDGLGRDLQTAKDAVQDALRKKDEVVGGLRREFEERRGTHQARKGSSVKRHGKRQT